MANVLGGLLAGMQSGNAANAARAKAKAVQDEKDRSFALKVGTESRMLTGAGEDQVARLQAQIDSPTWDPAMTVTLLKDAGEIDKAYGKVLGYSVQSRFAKKLHATGSKKSGDIPAGVMGPGLKIESDTTSPLAGFTGKKQKNAYRQAEREQRTKDIAGGVQAAALDYINKVTGGKTDPDMAFRALTDYQADLLDRADLDPQLIMDVMNNLRENMADTFGSAMPLTHDEEMARARLIDSRTKSITKFIETRFAAEGAIAIQSILEGRTEIIDQMKNFANTLIIAGAPLPIVEQQLSAYFIGKDGKWPSGRIANPYEKGLAAAPPRFVSELYGLYEDHPEIDPALWKPVYDEQSKTGHIVNAMTGQVRPFWQPAIIDTAVSVPGQIPELLQPPAAGSPGPSNPPEEGAPAAAAAAKQYTDENGKPLTGDALERAKRNDRAKKKLSALFKGVTGRAKDTRGQGVPAYPGSIQSPQDVERALLADASNIRNKK